jgi:HEAT repeat protein
MRADPAGCRATIRPLVTDDDPDLRQAAIWALGHVFVPSDMDTLREALAAPDPVIRRTALGSLPSVDSNPRVDEILTTILRDRDARTRHDAVLLLVWSAPPAVVDHLVSLTADLEWIVRSALGEARLAEDTDPTVRETARTGLGHGD